MTRSPTPSCGRMLAWHLVSTLALLLLPSMLLTGPVWSMPRADLRVFGLLLLAYAVSGLYPVVGCRRDKLPRTRQVLLMIAGVFGVVFLGLLLTRWPYPRVLLSAVFGAALVVIPVVSARPRSVFPAIPLAGVLLLAGLLGGRDGPPATPPPASARRTALVRTALYNLQIEFFRGAIPRSQILGGGLARLGQDYLLVTGDGRLYRFGWQGREDSLSVRPLPYPVPANSGEFEAALGLPQGEDRNPEAAAPAPFWFRGTLGLHAQVIADSVRVFASYIYWLDQQKCFLVRVAMLEAPLAVFLNGEPGPTWRVIYATKPCLPLHGSSRPEEWLNDATWPFAGYGAGGRLILAGRDSLLLSVGDFERDGVTIPGPAVAQDPAGSYGKTILIHLDGRGVETFSMGHRNPQGLHRDESGSIWLTEHGPQGGDELNLLVAGGNYGWPLVTFGTNYGSTEWPLSRQHGGHGGFAAPVYAWVPSIAISDLVRIKNGLFPAWRGDLLVGTLRKQELHRIRTQGGRVVQAEIFTVGEQIRALVEGEDGRIVLWTDASSIGSVLPNRGTTGEAIYSLRCAGCHVARQGSSYSLAPNLSGVVGRPVASLSGFGYSPGLRALGGKWTEERLDAFVANPRALVPGTSMAYPGLADSAERAAIIEYLRTRP